MGIKQLRSNKGFTLVEIIVTLSIFAIILTVGGTVYFQGNRMFTTTAVKNTEKSIGDNMYAFMRDRLIYATKLQVIDPLNPNQEPENQNAKVFKLNDAKHLELSGKDIYGNDYYSGYTVSYNVDIPKNDKGKYSADQLNLTVYVKKGDEIVYQTGSTIKNLNLIPQNSSIEIKQATKPPISEPPYDNPVIVFEEDVSSGIVFAPIELRQYAMEVSRQIRAYEASGTTNKLGEKGSRDRSLLPDKWIEYYDKFVSTNGNYAYFRNDLIREYVLMRYYRNKMDKTNLQEYWPSFSGFDAAIIEKVDNQIKDRLKEYPGGMPARYLSDYLTPDKDIVLAVYTFMGINNAKLQLLDKPNETISVSIPGDDSCFVYVQVRQSGMTGWDADLVYDFEDGSWYYYYRLKDDTTPNSKKSIQDVQWTNKALIPGRSVSYEYWYTEELRVVQRMGIKDKIQQEKYWIKIDTK